MGRPPSHKLSLSVGPVVCLFLCQSAGGTQPLLLLRLILNNAALRLAHITLALFVLSRLRCLSFCVCVVCIITMALWDAIIRRLLRNIATVDRWAAAMVRACAFFSLVAAMVPDCVSPYHAWPCSVNATPRYGGRFARWLHLRNVDAVPSRMILATAKRSDSQPTLSNIPHHARPFSHRQTLGIVWRFPVRSVRRHTCDRGSAPFRLLPSCRRKC